jgi:hypothetical protein
MENERTCCWLFAEALDTRHPRVMATTLKVIQQLATSCREMGQMLVPYYRHILPTLNIYITKNSKSKQRYRYISI